MMTNIHAMTNMNVVDKFALEWWRFFGGKCQLSSGEAIHEIKRDDKKKWQLDMNEWGVSDIKRCWDSETVVSYLRHPQWIRT